VYVRNLGFSVKLNFSLSQHSRDTILIKSFVQYLNCGNLNSYNDGKYIIFRVSKFSDINEKIIPFFTLKGEKLLNFEDFCKICDLKNNKLHLKKDVREKINIIKSEMNFSPIKSYINILENKKQIFLENKNQSGIYIFTNLINGKKIYRKFR
jgi:hypothetical protein